MKQKLCKRESTNARHRGGSARSSVEDFVIIRSWKIHKRSGSSLIALVNEFNPRIRGWLEYYGAFRRSSMRKICEMFHMALIKWAKNKYRRFNKRWSRAYKYFKGLAIREPKILVYWEWGWCLGG